MASGRIRPIANRGGEYSCPEDIGLEDIGLGNTIALIEPRRFLASHDTRCLGLSAISVNFMSS